MAQPPWHRAKAQAQPSAAPTVHPALATRGAALKSPDEAATTREWRDWFKAESLRTGESRRHLENLHGVRKRPRGRPQTAVKQEE